MILYHTGFDIIRKPDVHYGRKNADFGQGFYLTPEQSFAERWAKAQKGRETYVNVYALDETGLAIQRFVRDEAWFGYIRDNRALRPDRYAEADVIVGPIANDTLYDTFGIITSGFLSDGQALQLLLAGPAYTQVMIKSERALGQLVWQSARVLSEAEMAGSAALVRAEEESYQTQIAGIMPQWSRCEWVRNACLMRGA